MASLVLPQCYPLNGTLTRLLAHWQPGREEGEVAYHRLAVAALAPQDLLEDAFRPIARDGAATIEVVLRLLYSLNVIAHSNPTLRDAALTMARDAAGRARAALTAPADLAALEEATNVTMLATASQRPPASSG